MSLEVWPQVPHHGTPKGSTGIINWTLFAPSLRTNNEDSACGETDRYRFKASPSLVWLMGGGLAR